MVSVAVLLALAATARADGGEARRQRVCVRLLPASPRAATGQKLALGERRVAATSTGPRVGLPAPLRLAVAAAAAAPAARGTVSCVEVAEGPSYVEWHTQRVMHAFFYFQPPNERPEDELNGDRLDYLRERDRLLLFRAAPPSVGRSDGIGVALFGAAVVMAAHAPESMRAIFDGSVHLGPAVFDTGGMGAAAGMVW